PASKVTGFGLDGLGQLAPEFGIMLTPDWAVAIEGRMEWIPQAKNVSRFTASGAQSVLVRVLHYTKQDRLRFFFGSGAGGGGGARGGEGARMTVAYPDPERMYDIKDTIVIGPFLVGGTAGILYEIGTHLSWMAETNIYVGLPKVGFNADLNTALQINFGTTAK